MIRKLTMLLLSGAICLLGAIPVLAEIVMPSPAQYTTIGEYEEAIGKKITKFNEAPALKTKVATGELPSVKERLPKEPMVVMPVEEIGQYGGTWRRVWLGLADLGGVFKLMFEPIITFSTDGSEVLPNIAKSWEVSEGGKVYTFHLRKGIKWSDGVPFTADDILFVYEDVLLNKELNPVFPAWLTVGGKPAKLEKVDDYTIRFRFADSYGIFLLMFAYRSASSTSWYFYAPKHYLQQFHPRYTSMDKLKKMAEEAGFKSWEQLYQAKGGTAWFVTNPDCPTIQAWKVTVPPPAQRMVMERNPYYWKVDPEGNQLPYIDRIVNDMVEDAEMINMKCSTGVVDFQQRKLTMRNFSLFMEYREKGDYRVLKWIKTLGADPVIKLNLTCKDPVLRKLFEDDRFRKSLSLAINRDEINELCWLGQAEPRQASLSSGMPYYSEEWEKAYAEYDLKKANSLLDEIGLKWDKNHEYRLRPAGKTLAVTIEFTPAYPVWADTLGLVKDYWKEIGIEVALKPEERGLYMLRVQGNEHQIGIWIMDNQVPFLVGPRHLIPVETADTHGLLCIEYARWYVTGGKAGEKPVGDVARLQELYDKIKLTVHEEKRRSLVEEIIQLHIKNIWMIGTVGEMPTPVVVKNNFRNVPETLLLENILGYVRTSNPYQFFIRQK